MQAGNECRGEFLPRQKRAERQSARQGLGDNDDVRRAVQPLVGKLLAGAAETALNFIGNQSGAMLRRERPCALPEFVVDWISPAWPWTGSMITAENFIREFSLRGPQYR